MSIELAGVFIGEFRFYAHKESRAGMPSLNESVIVLSDGCSLAKLSCDNVTKKTKQIARYPSFDTVFIYSI